MRAERSPIVERYVDAAGVRRRVPRRSLQRLAEILGEAEPPAEPVSVLVRGGRGRLGPGEIELEGGGRAPVDDVLPDEVPSGYHRFVEPGGRTGRLIVSPGRCPLPPHWRAWGWSSQLYATRSEESWGLGDLGDLARLARWSRARHAGFVLVNPLGAVAPGPDPEPSPYFPTSRRMRNPIYLRVLEVPGAEGARAAVEAAAREGRRLNERRVIRRQEVWRLKLGALEAIWESGPPLSAFERWRADQPPVLEQFARWSVLAERHGPRWRQWPADCRSPEGTGVAAVAAEHASRVAFHAWLQWLVALQLEAAAGPLAVIQDLPIGVDPEGFDAWTWQEVFAQGVSVGAPPDEFNQRGQDWGLPPFVPWRLRNAGYEPFIESIRAALASGGGLRIDHVMGLFRLWWIPHGLGPGEGGYVRYPAEDLLSIVALESERAGAVVVGEDLGTVEASVRTMLAERDILSYRLLWFEDDPPSKWPARAMAAVTTHDLPTVAGVWTGADLEDQERAEVEPNAEGTRTMKERLGKAADLSPAASADDAVLGAYRTLAQAPCVLLGATLEDAVAEERRPNIPGGRGRPNWSLALPVTLEDLASHPLVARVADVLDTAVRGEADPLEPAPQDGPQRPPPGRGGPG